MAKLRIKLEGKPGAISLGVFRETIDHMSNLLTELESSVTGEPGPDVDWVVTELSLGSLVIAIDSVSAPDYVEVGQQVATAVVSGLEQIERHGTTPPQFTPRALRMARKLFHMMGRHGTEALAVSTDGASVKLTPAAESLVAPLLTERRTSIGSVEGRLETISVHKGDHFVIYHGRTGKRVECIMRSPEQLELAKNGLRRRVNVSGIVHSNARGEPMRVDVQRIRIFPDDEELPTIDELAGSDRGFTGGLSTDEFIRFVRGE